MVALDFCDDQYKLLALNIPEEFANVEICEISIEKYYLDKGIHFSAFFKMGTWLLEQFNLHPNAIFTYVCALGDLQTNHSAYRPQFYRWKLFNTIQNRLKFDGVLVQDVVIGEGDNCIYAKAFYRDCHRPIIHLITTYLTDKD